MSNRTTTVARVERQGLCMQCGTCAGVCPRGAIRMEWGTRSGLLPRVDDRRCDECGDCLAVCPGEGLDYTPAAWWRARAGDVASADFLGPWRKLWFGWAADEATRHAGASGGVVTAILQGALDRGAIDAAIVVRMDADRPLSTEPVIARSAEQITACRGSKYNAVAVNTLLRRLGREPGRYAVVGLPCHIQGLRLAQERLPVLQERVVLALGIFCGWTCLPRGTEIAARRAAVDPESLESVGYRGPGWPGGLRLTTRSGRTVARSYPDYYDRWMYAWTPARCLLCPDATAELADISLGDAWLDRFQGSPGVSDVIARTEVGEQLMRLVAPDRLALTAASPDEVLASQRETYEFKRNILRGRSWLRGIAGRALPGYPGIPMEASTKDRLAGVTNIASELMFRAAGDIRYRR